ncbi:MAG: DUF6530 family protein [Bacteroidales bacterium]|nr:DUF6530 family protein [Bacteroidales bacterium]MCL2738358.1 DUF6530 family protein [Bacteroidales bacterium]
MKISPHIKHKPITFVDNYDQLDGIYAGKTDAKYLSVGTAQYGNTQISAKVLRHTGQQWSPQSEELPLHRVFDLCTLILKSILLSANVQFPNTSISVGKANLGKLKSIIDYYTKPVNRSELLPKIQELQIVLNDFMQKEPKL